MFRFVLQKSAKKQSGRHNWRCGSKTLTRSYEKIRVDRHAGFAPLKLKIAKILVNVCVRKKTERGTYLSVRAWNFAPSGKKCGKNGMGPFCHPYIDPLALCLFSLMVDIGMLISQYRQFLYLCNMVLSSFQSVAINVPIILIHHIIVWYIFYMIHLWHILTCDYDFDCLVVNMYSTQRIRSEEPIKIGFNSTLESVIGGRRDAYAQALWSYVRPWSH